MFDIEILSSNHQWLFAEMMVQIRQYIDRHAGQDHHGSDRQRHPGRHKNSGRRRDYSE
ncbi:MAG: hypothetical protein UV05_C0048G0006 [candidate division CPR1 bacterium GW2011_GWA2_42_17]|uniref:Uncharacterized protein n=1 Tax=candidate division CPR1 bacterium GW2011_GWA2_42_17 TaxID=1618341 RepID=A0A0G1B747_9BACT|nr:MAG: hypothetical protein UV05_C0048G0006 [candidate division CPR1 bacterium GW2011_GWA2_42_17]